MAQRLLAFAMQNGKVEQSTNECSRIAGAGSRVLLAYITTGLRSAGRHECSNGQSPPVAPEHSMDQDCMGASRMCERHSGAPHLRLPTDLV